MAVSGNRFRIVVFGGIGSGKSTFAGLLGESGALVVNADRVGHEVLVSDADAVGAIKSIWPDVFTEGEVDRKRLAAAVFADVEQLRRLEQITHPAIARRILETVATNEDRHVVVELPVVRDFLGDDWTWVLVDAPEETRLQRAVDRGSARHDVVARMAQQPGAEELYARADWVVANNGTLDDLRAAAGELWNHLGT